MKKKTARTRKKTAKHKEPNASVGYVIGPNDEELLTTGDVCRITKFCRRTIERLRKQRKFVEPVFPAGHKTPRYLKSEIVKWLRELQLPKAEK